MARTHRLSKTGVLFVCAVGTPWSGTLFANEMERPLREPPSSQSAASATGETRLLTSTILAPATPINRRQSTMDLFSPSPTRPEHSRLTLNGEDLTADPLFGSVTHGTFKFAPTEPSEFAGQIYQGQPYPMRRGREGSVAAIMIGALASITGAAILVYANRPECSANQLASGCGYGTKVVGGAVLSGGIVGLFVGALTWR